MWQQVCGSDPVLRHTVGGGTGLGEGNRAGGGGQRRLWGPCPLPLRGVLGPELGRQLSGGGGTVFQFGGAVTVVGVSASLASRALHASALGPQRAA